MKNSILEDIYMIEYDVWENIPESEQYLNINEAFQEAVEKLSETLTDEQKTLLNEIVGLKTEE